MVITVEPIIAAGGGAGVRNQDDWIIRTADGSLAAHFEHAIVVPREAPIRLTA